MKLRPPAVIAVALLAVAMTAPLFSQADKPIDPKELAAVQKIRTRIEERAKTTGSAKPVGYDVTIPNTTVHYSMAPVPAGEFLMGAADGNSQPPHKVRLDAFWMQAHEVTWDAYLLFMFADQAKEREHADALVDALSRPTAPFLEMSFGRGNSGYPAISMTQHAASKFAQWLSAKTGEFYRLPTEAEWEYACRAGATTAVPAGALGDYAWFAANSAEPNFTDGTYHKVGTKKPNAWGLYDMLGNVREWTADTYLATYYANSPVDDPPGAPPNTGLAPPGRGTPGVALPVIRGGGWPHPEDALRVSDRYHYFGPTLRVSDVGFRLVRQPVTP